MASVWTVAPESVTKELTFVDAAGTAHGFWIKIKKRLSIGEQRRVQTAGWQGIKQRGGRGEQAEQEITIDWKLMGFSRAAEYLLDWSLEDDSRVKLPITRETLEALHPEVFALIDGAVSAHVEEMEQEKKAPSGSAAPSAT